MKQNETINLFVTPLLKNIEIPEELRNFLKIDDQGIDGLDFMLKHDKLSKKIPRNVRVQYEILYASIINELNENLKQLEDFKKELDENPKEIVHEILKLI